MNASPLLVLLLACSVCCHYQVLWQDVGTQCNGTGTCMAADSCPEATRHVREGVYPIICDFAEGGHVIICCMPHLDIKASDAFDSKILVQAPNPRTNTTFDTKDKCEQAIKEHRQPYTNQTSRNKCIDASASSYQCDADPSRLRDRYHLVYHCENAATPLIIGGTTADQYEFPHMVILGYKVPNTEEDYAWVCGGTLISDRFVLTAAHCIYNPNSNSYVTKVRMGTPNISARLEEKYTYTVINRTKYPDYKTRTMQHDIALLELDRPVPFDVRVKPACLHAMEVPPETNLTAIGYGLTKYGGDTSDKLMKVQLQHFDFTASKNHLLSIEDGPTTTNLNEETQMFAGSLTKKADACQGDSGGPLLLQLPDFPCMHFVVGITSFGLGCGMQGVPGVYTRVSHYVPWIENIVWPRVK